MKEEIFYVPDDYAENLVRQYTGQERKNMIAHLKYTLRILKFYTNNDFAFKDVHNEQLFLQNGKILVEVVQLFEKFRIIGSENLQMLRSVMRNKKIQILLVFVLAIGLFGLLFYWRYGEKKQMESLNGLQETYKEYDKKIREIRNDMENKKAEVNDIEKPANVILAFSEEDQELMDRIVPALEGRGIQATLVLKNTAEHHQETVTYLGQQGWDFAFGGEIGEEKDAYIEMLKSTVKQYEESTGKIAGAYFFNGKEYGRGSKILYPNFKEMDFKIGVAFAKDASSLKHGKNTDYNMEIEECQNISMREDMETIENILDQVIEARSVVVLSDFSLERQMEIAGEASLEHFEEILDLLLQKQSESDLVVGSVTCYEGTLEDRANRIEQRRQKYSEYEQKCLEEIEQLTKQRDEALEKQEVKK